MILTPLGPIKIFINDNEIEYTARSLNNMERHCPNVNGRYLIEYEYKREFKIQHIKCCIPSIDVKGDIESGERLESIAFYKDDIKLTIGAEGEFHEYPMYLDYSGDYLDNGIQYKTFQATAARTFKFGVSWIQPYTEENEVQTWFGADPTMM
ncbi:hypothetical protein [Bacillus mesophilum]|uniref:Uncharacterized protein n=1 Tax=Bacillus mesophilum TaxID=1071718 RepID=A0A7V7RP16_9BACI|nr:hypothetical protein [Bacillus mesophilum]KAB2334308.1 hypothetical protein F7732_09575 [Bacillus mesophilum]